MCESEFLPQQFTYRILKKMENGGLVRISRGVEGGVELVADLHKITLFDLLNILDKKRVISACMQPGYDCNWTKANGPCVVHQNLTQVQKQLDSLLSSKSLHQVLFEQ